MHVLGLLATMAISSILSLGATGKVDFSKRPAKDTRVIVEFDKSYGLSNRTNLINYQNSILSNFDNYTVLKHYTGKSNSALVNIAGGDIEILRSLPGVKNVVKDKIVGTAIPDEFKNTHYTPENISAETMNKPESSKEGEGTVIAILDDGFNLNHISLTDLDNSVATKFTQDNLKPIITGEGFHGQPDATHSTYWNKKVPFYFDYGGTGDAPSHSYDVISKVSSHGAHVASIAAGNDPQYKGIAPKAQLVLMKVFTENKGTSSGAYDSAICEALEDCEKLGVDIVNLSLGNDLIDYAQSDSEFCKIVDRLQAKGTFVNIAAGNSGHQIWKATDYGNKWTTDTVETSVLSTYSNNESSFTVAASNPEKIFYPTALTVNGKIVEYDDQIVNTVQYPDSYKTEHRFSDLVTGPDDKLDWVKIPGVGKLEDFNGLNVDGKISVIDRGDITFEEKITNAQNLGSIGVIVINNEVGQTEFNVRMDLNGFEPDIPVAYALYRSRVHFTTGDGKGQCSFVKDKIMDSPDADTMTTFSSDGARFDLNIKPDITAPGARIKGAVYLDDKKAVHNDTYDDYDGTSMATPNVTGAVSLLLSEGISRESLQATMMSTAKPMPQNNEGGKEIFATPRQQGAGLVDIKKALDTPAYINGYDCGTKQTLNKAKINLKQDEKLAKGKLNLSFSVINNSESAITYTAKTYVQVPEIKVLEGEDYGVLSGVELYDTDDKLIETFTDSVTANKGTTKIDLAEHTISEANMNYINDHFKYGCVVEGFVVLTPSDVSLPEISVPFLGFCGDYENAEPVEPFNFQRDNSKVYPSTIANMVADRVDLPEADYTSMVTTGPISNMQSFTIEPVLTNEQSIRTMSGFETIGYNPLMPENDCIDPDHLYLGNNGYTSCFLVQQYVMRSVETNTITLTNTDTGEVVLTDHMFSMLTGGDDNYGLCKSTPIYERVEDKYFADRAYSIIPMFDPDNTVHKYPDGHYNMHFDYTMCAGGNFQMDVNFTLDSKAPQFQRIEKSGNNFKVFFTDNEYMGYARINGKTWTSITKVGNEYCVEVPNSGERIFVEGFDGARAPASVLFYPDSYEDVFITSDKFGKDATYLVEETPNGDKGNDFTYTITTKTTGGKIISGEINVTLKLKDTFIGLEQLYLFEVDDDGNQTALEFKIENDHIIFKSKARIFRLTAENKTPDPKPSGNNNLGIIIGASVGGAVALGGIVTLVVFLIKKKKVK